MASIKVSVRFRPQSAQEQSAGAVPCVECVDDTTALVGGPASRTEFKLDRVFGCDATQEQVYDRVARPLVADVLAGYNCTVFAYGQTGSGKTHTLLGRPFHPELRGLVPRAIDQMFEAIAGIAGTAGTAGIAGAGTAGAGSGR